MSVKHFGTVGGFGSKCQYVNVARNTQKSGNSKDRNGEILSAESAALSREVAKCQDSKKEGTLSGMV